MKRWVVVWLKRLVEEINKNNADKLANVEFNNKGLSINSLDKQYSFKLKGYVQADSQHYANVKNHEVDQFLVRSSRLTFEAKFPNNFSTRTMLDFGNGNSRLVDGYGDWKLSDKFSLKFGKFKTPIGLERWQSETDVLFVERGLTTNLVPFRDIGVGVSGTIIPQTFEYQITLTNGIGDLGDSNGGDAGSGKDLSARIFVHPFKNTDLVNLQNFGIQNVKINFDFSNNNFKGGALNKVDRKDENAFLTRLQLKF